MTVNAALTDLESWTEPALASALATALEVAKDLEAEGKEWHALTRNKS